MQALAFLTVASLAAMAAGEAPSRSYGAPSSSYGAPSASPSRQPQRLQQKPQPQSQAFAQSQAQPSFAAPQFSGFPTASFRPQFFIPAQDSARLTDIYRLPSFTTSAPTTEAATTTTTTEAPTTTEAAGPYNYNFPGSQSAALQESEESGVYYVLQPDGRLQRIAYAHGPAPAAPQQQQQQQQQQRAAPSELSGLQQPALTPGYLARFQYQDLHPAGAPIYSYKQPELVRIN